MHCVIFFFLCSAQEKHVHPDDLREDDQLTYGNQMPLIEERAQKEVEKKTVLGS